MKQIIFLCESKICTSNPFVFYIIHRLNITLETISMVKEFEDKKILIKNKCPNCEEKQLVKITSVELQKQFNLYNI